jgi:hypothetical protein
MHVKVEPTGTLETKGLVQVRLCMYLDEGDYGYEKHFIETPERALTDKELEDPELAELVPVVGQVNPFHNHFIYVDHSTSDKEIMDKAEILTKEAYILWSGDKLLNIENDDVVFPEVVDKVSCDDRVADLKATEPSKIVEVS